MSESLAGPDTEIACECQLIAANRNVISCFPDEMSPMVKSLNKGWLISGQSAAAVV
jgi:hypothetical protein